MSYEVELISPQTVNVQHAEQREERVINPYISRMPKPPIGQTDIVKGPEETKAPSPTEETVRLSPQIAALARKEQKFRAQQQEFERQRAEIAAEKAEIAQLKSIKEKLAAKDYSALESLGVDYNEFSQYQVDKANGANPVQEELRSLKTKVSEMEKNQETNLEKQFEAAVNERRIAAKQLVESGTYPRIKKAQAHEAVVQHILDTWEHDSEELSVEDAAKEVEEVLLEQAKKWKELLEDTEEVPVEQKKSLPPMKPALRTLTNQVTSGDLTRPRKSYQNMSDSERYAEARRRAEEKLQAGRGY